MLFPLPGFPMIIKGIFVFTDQINKNTFSFNNVFLPISGSNSIWAIKYSSSILRKS